MRNRGFSKPDFEQKLFKKFSGESGVVFSDAVPQKPVIRKIVPKAFLNRDQLNCSTNGKAEKSCIFAHGSQNYK
jgi:hypothetical protein